MVKFMVASDTETIWVPDGMMQKSIRDVYQIFFNYGS